MAEEKKSVSKQSKKSAAEKKEDSKPADVKVKSEPKAKSVSKDEYQELRERLLRDYKGRLSAEQIENRINIIKQSKENK